MKKTVLKYDVIFEEQSEGGYTVTVPSLSGCISEGDTFEQAKDQAAKSWEKVKEKASDLTQEAERKASETVFGANREKS